MLHDSAVAVAGLGAFQESTRRRRPDLHCLPVRAEPDLNAGGMAEIVRGLRMTVAVNALGLPAVAVPVGNGNGLPQAVQVIGPRFREDLCLDAAAAIEDAVGIITPIDPR